MGVHVVVFGGEGEPGALAAHQLVRVAVGVRPEDRAAGEVAGAAPLESGVTGHLTARGGGGTEGERLGAQIGEPDRPVERPGAGGLVDRVHGQATLLSGPLLAAVLHPGQRLGDVQPGLGNRERGETVVPHGTDALRQRQIALPVDIAVAAPEVLPRQMARRHLQALVPAVVVGTVPGHRAAAEGAHRVGVRLLGLEGLGVGSVDVAEDLRAVRRLDGEVLAVDVADADAHARSLGAQWGWSPCMAG